VARWGCSVSGSDLLVGYDDRTGKGFVCYTYFYVYFHCVLK
jgi:hypothetical protein